MFILRLNFCLFVSFIVKKNLWFDEYKFMRFVLYEWSGIVFVLDNRCCFVFVVVFGFFLMVIVNEFFLDVCVFKVMSVMYMMRIIIVFFYVCCVCCLLLGVWLCICVEWWGCMCCGLLLFLLEKWRLLNFVEIYNGFKFVWE